MSGKTKDHKIGMCGFSAKHETFRSKSTDGFALNLNNVSK
jgi:hypothetical protein